MFVFGPYLRNNDLFVRSGQISDTAEGGNRLWREPRPPPPDVTAT